MITIDIPADKKKLEKQIKALEYQLKRDTDIKDIEIHRVALEKLKSIKL